MDDLISRQAAIGSAVSGMTMTIGGEWWIRVSEVRKSLYSVPSAQRKGKWIDQKGGGCCCSECGKYALDEIDGNFIHVASKTDYCPWCGAEMKGEKDERIKNS